MPNDPEPLSDVEVDAALRELVGEDLARAREQLWNPSPLVAAAHVRRAADAARGPVADVAALDDARARRDRGLVRRRRRIGIAVGWAAAGVVVLGGASTGLAAAEVLPQPAARVIVAAVNAVGLPVPDPVERAAEPEPSVPAPPAKPAPELAAGERAPVTVGRAPTTPSSLPSAPTVAAVEAPSTTAGGPRSTLPAPTVTTAVACPAAAATTSTSTTSTTAPSSTTTTTIASTTTTTASAVAEQAPGCGADPGAQGAGAEPSTTTTSGPSTTTTTDPGATAQG